MRAERSFVRLDIQTYKPNAALFEEPAGVDRSGGHHRSQTKLAGVSVSQGLST